MCCCSLTPSSHGCRVGVCSQGTPFISTPPSGPGPFCPSGSDVTSPRIVPGPKVDPPNAPSPRAPPSQLVLEAPAAKGLRWPRAGGAASHEAASGGRTTCLQALGQPLSVSDWELVRNANSQACPRPAESFWGREPEVCLGQPSRGFRGPRGLLASHPWLD